MKEADERRTDGSSLESLGRVRIESSSGFTHNSSLDIHLHVFAIFRPCSPFSVHKPEPELA
jgi:hypothetical protein